VALQHLSLAQEQKPWPTPLLELPATDNKRVDRENKRIERKNHNSYLTFFPAHIIFKTCANFKTNTDPLLVGHK